MDLKNQISKGHIAKWWDSRRGRYNIGLIISGISAFILFNIIGFLMSNQKDSVFEVTFFTILFQGFGYLLLMGIANIFYYLGPFIDKRYNTFNDESFREKLYYFGFWFSCLLPFIIPFLLLIKYLF